MLIKIKTFSGETLYIPEEDYLNEVMYSDLEEREFAKTPQAIQKKILKYRGQAKYAQQLSGHPFNLESRIRGQYADAAYATARGNQHGLIQNSVAKDRQAEFQSHLRNRRQYLRENGNAPLTRLQELKNKRFLEARAKAREAGL